MPRAGPSSSRARLPDGDLVDYPAFIHADYSGLVDGAEGEMKGDEERDEAETKTVNANLRQSGSGDSIEDVNGSPKKKKPRITLARGRACVACRSRKLKCTGENPCKTCKKAKIECRYEEIQFKKPRAVLLHERVAELEALLIMRGEPIPPGALAPSAGPSSPSSLNLLTPRLSPSKEATEGRPKLSLPPLVPFQTPALSLHSHQDIPPNQASMNTSEIEIVPNSALEHALLNVVLPYTPHLFIPVHPQRFLSLLTLPPNDPQRPHPALLYILFAEALRILERSIPRPQLPRPPTSLFPQTFSALLPGTPVDPGYILSHVHCTSLSLLERARTELDRGIRNVDRPYDLVRAALGITRHLYSLGRFIEGWNIPVARLLVSCGFHRMTGNTIRPDGGAPCNLTPQSLPPAHFYGDSHPPTAAQTSNDPILRMPPVIIPPARDEIEMAERNMTFWAAKTQDWAAGIKWGWTTALADDECTTEWPWGWGSVEIKPAATSNLRWNIRDLHDPTSMIHTSPFPDTTFALAIQSIGLLHRTSRLFDLPEPPTPCPDGQMIPTSIPPLSAVKSVQTALELFRKRIPPVFTDMPGTGSSNPLLAQETYDGMADPWWILCHMNLYTAEMLMWMELAHYRSTVYETAVRCARAVVGLVRRMRPESWVHLNMIAALDLSLAGKGHGAAMASEEAELLRAVLARDYSKWLPMAGTQALIVQRFREGWPEKEREYDRV